MLPTENPKIQELRKFKLQPNYFEILFKTQKSGGRVTLTYIPKAGKSSHPPPKDYRPISLPFFLLKTLGRLIDIETTGTSKERLDCILFLQVIIKWLYESIVRPILSCGALVW